MNNIAEAVAEDEGAAMPPRADSLVFSPKLETDASMPTPKFPVSVSRDETLHEPPRDKKTLFTSPPRLNKYVDLIDQLLHPKPDEEPTFSREVVDELCNDITTVLQGEPSLLEISVGPEDKLVVVGDVHGQFSDMTHHVLNIQYDKPNDEPDRKMLFLGDYVDRGPQGVETVLLLFALKCEYPNSIFLLRGNHEESQTSRIYGFLFEVRTKFGDISVWARFNAVFCYLPLAATILCKDKKFFAVHGGLSPSLTDVDTIREIERADYGGMLDNASSDIVDGLLWSDPTDNTMRFARNERGCGYLFGPRATADFCEENGLEFICRAHQMTMTGYTWCHDNKVITVFSAPNYCGISNNMAAIMIVDHNLNLNFIQFSMAPNRGPQAPLPMTMPWGSYFN